jgi:hypothetical protein
MFNDRRKQAGLLAHSTFVAFPSPQWILTVAEIDKRLSEFTVAGTAFDYSLNQAFTKFPFNPIIL